MIIYYILFILFLAFALYDYRFTDNTKQVFLVLGGLLLILLAGMRDLGVDNDYHNYLDGFHKMHPLSMLFSNPKVFFSVEDWEPSIILISSTVKTLFGNNAFPIVTLIYATLSISLIIMAINKLSEFKMFSLLFFFSSFFFLQHMTQIRTAVASGFLLLSIPYAVNRKFWKFSALIFCGIFFHYSAIVMFPIYFLSSKTINKTLYFSLIIGSIALAVLHFTPFDFIIKYNFGVFTEKIKTYLEMQQWQKNKINIFNFSVLFQLLITSIFLFYHDLVKNKNIILFIKISCWGIIVFYLFSASPTLAFRTSEVLNVVLIILVPYFYHIIRPKALAESVIVLISLVYFLNQIVINKIIQDYTTFL